MLRVTLGAATYSPPCVDGTFAVTDIRAAVLGRAFIAHAAVPAARPPHRARCGQPLLLSLLLLLLLLL